MKPNTHLGENARQIEVSDDQTQLSGRESVELLCEAFEGLARATTVIASDAALTWQPPWISSRAGW